MSHDGPLPPPYRHLELELEVGSAPISGFLSGGGVRRDFQGWVDLAAAIAREHEGGDIDVSDH